MGRRSEFLSTVTNPDGIIEEEDNENVFTGLQADEKLMLETTLQLIKDGGSLVSDTLTAG